MSENKTEELLEKLLENQRKGIDIDLKTIIGALGLLSIFGTIFLQIVSNSAIETLSDQRHDSDQLIQLSASLESALQKVEKLEKSIDSAIGKIENKTEDLSDRVSEIEKKLYLLEKREE